MLIIDSTGSKGAAYFATAGMNGMNGNMDKNANNHREVLYSELQERKGHSSP